MSGKYVSGLIVAISSWHAYFSSYVRQTYCASRSPISTLALSLTQSVLLAGTTDGDIRLYDIVSHQLLRAVSPVKDKSQGLAVTHIECMLKPPDLIGHLSLDLHVSGVTAQKDVMPTRPIAPFQKVRDEKTREAHEVPILLPNREEVSLFPSMMATRYL